MANQLYGYNPSYGAAANLSPAYPTRSLADLYKADTGLTSSSRYLTSDPFSSNPSSYSVSGSSMFLNQNDGLRYSAADISGGAYSSLASRIPASVVSAGQSSWPGVDVGAALDPVISGMKRSTEALYGQTVLGAHNTFGQSEAWYSTNSLAKRSRVESASHLPIYPQRPGEKDCAHYMQTRTCKFGDSCKFDHPIWVPEGGIPDWKEVPLLATGELLPERLGEPDCPYYLKTQKCKFGPKCKFNHPRDKMVSLDAPESLDPSALPERPSEPACAFYIKTGKCKFGATCKFHHPKDIQIPSTGQENGNGVQSADTANSEGTTVVDVNAMKPTVSITPALLHNSKGLPIRPGEVDCPFYLKTGSCKYGATCRYNHPDFYAAINPPAAMVASPAASLSIGVVNPAASIFQTIDPRLTQPVLTYGPTVYPQRPGQIECDYYMKTGVCKFGERCKFHHPIDRSVPTQQAQQQSVKLTLAGLPRREGSIICPYYLKTATCKYGVTCKFDHPPPGEVMAMATSQGLSSSAGVGEERGDSKDAEAVQGQHS